MEKVKCIMKPGTQYTVRAITVGKEYEVLKTTAAAYLVNDNLGIAGFYSKAFFEEVPTELDKMASVAQAATALAKAVDASGMDIWMVLPMVISLFKKRVKRHPHIEISSTDNSVTLTKR